MSGVGARRFDDAADLGAPAPGEHPRGTGDEPVGERLVELAEPVDLALTLGAFAFGGHDPSLRIDRGAVWRATRTPAGAATVRIGRADGAGPGAGPSTTVQATAWGPGGGWALRHVPELLGATDRWSGSFDHPLVARLARRHPGLRLGRSRAVVATLVPTIIEQRVTTIEARRSYHALVRRFGAPAPGPAGRWGLRLGPDPERLAQLAYHHLHPFGVERRRADAVVRVCRRAASLDALVSGSGEPAGDALDRALASLPGVGPWTRAIVAQRALGDPDAVIVGDYHLPHLVSWNLAGEPRADDDRMLELLEPFRPQRARVVRLLVLGGRFAPRRGPRQRLRDIAAC
jgi:3-methyladenine DNA glycosylase/8-oxoguanine DNA glycosylase